MKNILIKFRDGLLIGLGIVTVLGITHAAVNLSASKDETLTVTKWNALVDKVAGINTDSSGNVGIGTENPQNTFSVFRGTPYETAGDTLDSYSIVDFTAKTNEDGIKRGLTIGAPTSNILSPVFLKVTGTSSRMGFLNQFNSESMSILDNGNVGIGTTNPATKLDIDGSLRLIPRDDGPICTSQMLGTIYLDTLGQVCACVYDQATYSYKYMKMTDSSRGCN